MTNVFDVAKYILTKQGEMTAMKLQKLVYYSQAWHAVWEEKPLFDEQIQAWINGPVVPTLYDLHRGKFLVTSSDICSSGVLLTDDEKDSIDRVLSFYGDKSSQWLSDLTHSETPWISAREGLAPNERGNREISVSSLAEYYEALQYVEKKTKIPRIAEEPILKKQPVIGHQFASDDSGQVFWSFSLVDCYGPWGFHDICRNELHDLVMNGFKHKEGVNWAELKSNGGCHNVAKYKLVKQAQQRLTEIKLDDLDELFSMRFTGKKRIWGIRDGNIFKILWWDPEHKVCPSPKKHT